MNRNNSIRQVVFCVTAATIASTAIAAPSSGKDILHYFASERITNTGVLANPSGRVDIHENSVSKGKPERLRLELRSLGSNVTYRLLALVGPDTNLTFVTEFSSDDRGRAKLDFEDRSNGSGSNSFPAALNPLITVHELAVQDTNGSNIVTADLSSPDKFEFFLKRDLSTNNVAATLQINAETHKARLRLSASGLNANTDYLLALNGVTVTTNTSNARGKLGIAWEVQHPVDILSLNSVSLLDTNNQAVLSNAVP